MPDNEKQGEAWKLPLRYAQEGFEARIYDAADNFICELRGCPGDTFKEGFAIQDARGRAIVDAVNIVYAVNSAAEAKPLDMLIFCPNCGKQHIDKPEPDTCVCKHPKRFHEADGRCSVGIKSPCVCTSFTIAWDNPPHKSHTCRKDYGGCGVIFRIASVPTNGVAEINPKGKDDTWPVDNPEEQE